jgi:hypothetical protein
MNARKVTRGDDMPGLRAMSDAADIEARLRDAGVPSLMIPGIIGAAFMASLTNLPPGQRLAVLHAHLETVVEMIIELRRADQAPDGPLPGLRNVEAYVRHNRRR